VVEGAVESIVGPTKKAAQGTKLQLIVDKSLPKKNTLLQWIIPPYSTVEK
jgi:hypothetical protein